jgi:heme A synthase
MQKEIKMSIPVLFDKPINVWLGIALVLVVILQIGSGIVLSKGKLPILPLHRLNALLLAAVVAVHAFYGIGYWFFDFKIG